MTAPTPTLARRLGTGDAVVVGLSAMIGAGVFSAFAPAAAAAGSGLLVGLLVAAVVATCNALSSAQLAAAHPTSGGTYLYGREVLGEWWGFAAGWAFVVGKTASCAAMAMTFAAYAVPGPALVQRATAVGALAVLCAANLRGITRTAQVARVLLAVTAVSLVGFVVGAWTSGAGDGDLDWSPGDDGGLLGVLRAAGLLFFAFAGYARVATLGEEVRRPDRIGRAVLTALAIVVVLYAVVGVTLLAVLGPAQTASVDAPVLLAVDEAEMSWLGPLVRVGAVAASLGALLALLAGIGRTALAMARNRDLPQRLSSVHVRHRVPDQAEIAVSAVAAFVVVTTGLHGAIGFSSFGVLTYYAIANLSALRQPPEQRRWPRAFNLLGVVGCVTLVASLPMSAVGSGLVVLAGGVAGRALVLRRRVRQGQRP